MHIIAKTTKRMDVTRRIANKSTSRHKTVNNMADSAIQHHVFEHDLHCALYAGFTSHLTFGDDSVYWNTRE